MGTKAVELYDEDVISRSRGGTCKRRPMAVIEREDAVNELYDRVSASKAKSTGLTVTISRV